MTPISALTPDHIDVLKELINIGVGRSIASLHDLLQSHIVMEVPKVEVMTPEEARVRFREMGFEPIASVNVTFSGPFSGVSSLFFTESNAEELVSLIGSKFPSDDGIETLRTGVLMEVGNIVLNSVMGSLGNLLEARFVFSVPEYFEGTSADILERQATETSAVLLSVCDFLVKSTQTRGHINLIFDIASLTSLLDTIDAMNP